MELVDVLHGVKKVIETEGNITGVERVIITKDEFMIVKDGNVYKVIDYEKLVEIKVD